MIVEDGVSVRVLGRMGKSENELVDLNSLFRT